MAKRSRRQPKANGAAQPDALTDAPREAIDTEDNSRDAQLCHEPEIEAALIELYADVEEGFQSQADRSDDILDYWDLYNCKMGPKQTYAGNSRIFVPIIRNAVEARKTRFTNQIFPQSQRYVECTTSDDKPNDLIALLEHYIRRDTLRTRVMPALMKNGDIEGQYSVYMTWKKTTRTVMQRVKRELVVDNEPIAGTEEDDIEEETIENGRPHAEVIADADICILPQTADSVEEAIEGGGSVTILRRWSKAQIKKKKKDREIDEEAADALLTMWDDHQRSGGDGQDKAAKMVDAAGIQMMNGRRYALVYETWTMLTWKDERRLYVSYFGSEELVLGCKRNPYWNDKVPILTAPIDRVQGSIKGISKLQPCADMQYAANDAVNEGMDSAAYSMLPIIMTDPLKNPRIGTMVLNLAAIWETSPKDTQFAQFPELWKSAFQMVNSCRTEIFQTLSVSPAVMPQSTTTENRRNQAEIAAEQQIDILSTADAVTIVEEGILTPYLQWCVELDHQFRKKEITVREFGEMGVRANMHEIQPIQMDKRYEFRWFGVEAARNAQQVQQQIAAMNVIRGIPPEQYAPYKLDLRPVISNLVESTFGPRLAPTIFLDPRSQLTQDPVQENILLEGGFDIPAHPLDDDAQHLQAHQQLMQGGDPTGVVRLHMMKHVEQLSMKTQQQAMAQQQAQMQQGMPGVPGGAGPGGPQPAPGVAGTPRMGAQPGVPRPQMPPGMIHHDQLQGPGIAPRR